MGDDWRYDSWSGLTSNWMIGSEYSNDHGLFNLVLKKAGEQEAREEIDKCSEKLNQLKAEKAEQSLVLLNSAMTGETDPVASLKLAQIEVDIDETQQRLTDAQLDQAHAYQSTVQFLDSYLNWKSSKTPDGWKFFRENNDNSYGWVSRYEEEE